MVHFRAGSQVWRLIMLLSFTGEFPYQSLSLLGKERVYKALVHKLITPQTFRNSQTGMEFTCRLLTVSGKGPNKTIRFYKGALPILEWLGPNVYRHYMDAFWNHRFPGDVAHRERNHRVAEAAAVCMRSGMEARPYRLPKLQNLKICQTVPAAPCLYLGKDIKKVGDTEMNKTMFTRMIGALFTPGSCYAVYNTRDAAMKWNGMGEFKSLHSLTELARLNAGTHRIDSAVLLGESEEIALRTLLESDKSRRLEFRFDSIYRHIHFIPMDEAGIRQLRLITVPEWKEKLLDLLFESKARSYDRGLFEYDACMNDTYILSHLDGDIARLLRFREAIAGQSGQFEVLGFPHQTHFLKAYLGQAAAVKTISLEAVEEGIEMERRNLFDG